MVRPCAVLAIAAATLFSGPLAFASSIVSQSAVYDPSTADVDFTIVFNHQVDFSYRYYGRQGDGFQYEIVGDPSQPFPLNRDAIIRGDEIFESGSELRIRYPYPELSIYDPNDADDFPQFSGGYGPIRAVVPYTLVGGTVLSFTVPLSEISDHSTDGIFTYQFSTDKFNSNLPDLFYAQSTIKPGAVVTPEPSSLLLLGTGLIGSVGILRRRVLQGERRT